MTQYPWVSAVIAPGLADELALLMQNTASGVQTQHAESDQVATAMHQMATTAQDVANSASGAAQAAHEAARQVERSASILGCGYQRNPQPGTTGRYWRHRDQCRRD